MSSRRVKSVVERGLTRVFGRSVVNPERAARFVLFCVVGATGAIVDVAMTVGLIETTSVHYLLANTAGFALAVSWNFIGNWMWTYGKPAGSLGRQYLSYVGLHGATFGVRAGVVAVIVEWAGADPVVGSLLGLGVAALLNFVGTEAIFDGVGEIWFDGVEAANHAAHVVWNSQVRHWLQVAGLYDAAYSLYARVLALSFRDDEREVTIGGADATLAMEHPTEIVSNLHTLEKEAEVLEAFVADIEPGDHVVDAGANLGAFAALGVGVADHVTAVEPHPETAERLGENLARNDGDGLAVQAALGDKSGQVRLACERDDLGSQRPQVSDEGQITVDQVRGDTLFSDDPPDVVKVDVEGGELAVLNGLDSVEESVRVWYVEAHGSEEAEDIIAWFNERGYRSERLTDGHEIHIRATEP